MTQQVCPACGFINTGNGPFCGNCGRSLAESAARDESTTGLCPHCGAENPTGAVFCGSCGLSLSVDQPPAEPHRPARRYLLPLVLLAGLIFLGAAAALFLLPRLGQDRASAALPDNQSSTAEGSSVAGGEEDATDVAPSEEAPSDGTPSEEAASVAEVSAVITTTTSAPTVTPFPTGTLRPTPTPLPTITSQPPTPLPPPTSVPPTAIPLPTTAPPTAPPLVACQSSPGDRWGPTLWARYQNELGCATTGEIHPNSAYQYYRRGMMVWREVPDLVYVLYNDGSFDVFSSPGPDGYFHSDWLKGSFGYLWNNNATVRDRVGEPQAAEFNTTNFAVQDFAGGTIIYFLENDARNYVLFNSSGTWVSAQQ